MHIPKLKLSGLSTGGGWGLGDQFARLPPTEEQLKAGDNATIFQETKKSQTHRHHESDDDNVGLDGDYVNNSEVVTHNDDISDISGPEVYTGSNNWKASSYDSLDNSNSNDIHAENHFTVKRRHSSKSSERNLDSKYNKDTDNTKSLSYKQSIPKALPQQCETTDDCSLDCWKGGRIVSAIELPKDMPCKAIHIVDGRYLWAAVGSDPVGMYDLVGCDLNPQRIVEGADDVTALTSVKFVSVTSTKPAGPPPRPAAILANRGKVPTENESKNNPHQGKTVTSEIHSLWCATYPSCTSSTAGKGSIFILDLSLFKDDGIICNAHPSPITFMYTLPEGTSPGCRVWTSSYDVLNGGILKVWDAASRKNITRKSMPGAVISACTLPPLVSSHVWTVTAGENGVRVWDYEGREVSSGKFAPNSNSLKFHAEARCVRYHAGTQLVWVALATSIATVNPVNYDIVSTLPITVFTFEFPVRNPYTVLALGFYNNMCQPLIMKSSDVVSSRDINKFSTKTQYSHIPSENEAPRILMFDIPLSSGRVGKDAAFTLTENMITFGQTILGLSPHMSTEMDPIREDLPSTTSSDNALESPFFMLPYVSFALFTDAPLCVLPHPSADRSYNQLSVILSERCEPKESWGFGFMPPDFVQGDTNNKSIHNPTTENLVAKKNDKMNPCVHNDGSSRIRTNKATTEDQPKDISETEGVRMDMSNSDQRTFRADYVDEEVSKHAQSSYQQSVKSGRGALSRHSSGQGAVHNSSSTTPTSRYDRQLSGGFASYLRAVYQSGGAVGWKGDSMVSGMWGGCYGPGSRGGGGSMHSGRQGSSIMGFHQSAFGKNILQTGGITKFQTYEAEMASSENTMLVKSERYAGSIPAYLQQFNKPVRSKSIGENGISGTDLSVSQDHGPAAPVPMFQAAIQADIVAALNTFFSADGITPNSSEGSLTSRLGTSAQLNILKSMKELKDASSDLKQMRNTELQHQDFTALYSFAQSQRQRMIEYMVAQSRVLQNSLEGGSILSTVACGSSLSPNNNKTESPQSILHKERSIALDEEVRSLFGVCSPSDETNMKSHANNVEGSVKPDSDWLNNVLTDTSKLSTYAVNLAEKALMHAQEASVPSLKTSEGLLIGEVIALMAAQKQCINHQKDLLLQKVHQLENELKRYRDGGSNGGVKGKLRYDPLSVRGHFTIPSDNDLNNAKTSCAPPMVYEIDQYFFNAYVAAGTLGTSTTVNDAGENSETHITNDGINIVGKQNKINEGYNVHQLKTLCRTQALHIHAILKQNNILNKRINAHQNGMLKLATTLNNGTDVVFCGHNSITSSLSLGTTNCRVTGGLLDSLNDLKCKLQTEVDEINNMIRDSNNGATLSAKSQFTKKNSIALITVPTKASAVERVFDLACAAVTDLSLVGVRTALAVAANINGNIADCYNSGVHGMKRERERNHDSAEGGLVSGGCNHIDTISYESKPEFNEGDASLNVCSKLQTTVAATIPLPSDTEEGSDTTTKSRQNCLVSSQDICEDAPDKKCRSLQLSSSKQKIPSVVLSGTIVLMDYLQRQEFVRTVIRPSVDAVKPMIISFQKRRSVLHDTLVLSVGITTTASYTKGCVEANDGNIPIHTSTDDSQGFRKVYDLIFNSERDNAAVKEMQSESPNINTHFKSTKDLACLMHTYVDLTTHPIFSDISFSHQMMRLCNQEVLLVLLEQGLMYCVGTMGSADGLLGQEQLLEEDPVYSLPNELNAGGLSTYDNRVTQDTIINMAHLPSCASKSTFRYAEEVQRLSSLVTSLEHELETTARDYRNDVHRRREVLEPLMDLVQVTREKTSHLCQVPSSTCRSAIFAAEPSFTSCSALLGGLARLFSDSGSLGTTCGNYNKEDSERKEQQVAYIERKLHSWRLKGELLWSQLWLLFVSDALIIISNTLSFFQDNGVVNNGVAGQFPTTDHISFLLEQLLSWRTTLADVVVGTALRPIQLALKAVVSREDILTTDGREKNEDLSKMYEEDDVAKTDKSGDEEMNRSGINQNDVDIVEGVRRSSYTSTWYDKHKLRLFINYLSLACDLPSANIGSHGSGSVTNGRCVKLSAAPLLHEFSPLEPTTECNISAVTSIGQSYQMGGIKNNGSTAQLMDPKHLNSTSISITNDFASVVLAKGRRGVQNTGLEGAELSEALEDISVQVHQIMIKCTECDKLLEKFTSSLKQLLVLQDQISQPSTLNIIVPNGIIIPPKSLYTLPALDESTKTLFDKVL